MKRIAIWIGLLVAVLVLLLCTILMVNREPTYQGKSLTDWTKQWQTNRWAIPKTKVNDDAEKEARLAVRAIGTNGIPFLLKLIQAQGSPARARLRKVIPKSWHQRLHLRSKHYEDINTGGYGLAALEELAAAAVPAVMQLVKAPDRQTRDTAMWTLGQLGAASEPAIPLMISCVTNHDRELSGDAIHGLGRIRLQPETVIPVLVNHIPYATSLNGNGEVCAILDALQGFGTNAVSAVPAIIPFLNDANLTVREYATSSLHRIDKATAEKLGVRWQ